MDYRNKVMLAPMVRIGTLPARLLALQYGADIVYTEEIIDYKMLQCNRQKNEILGTVDFVWNDGTVVFRTCDKEKGKVVFQMGTCDATRALKVAQLVEEDVAAIDINMGCPKEFSLKGGMGAALLTQPHNIKHILTTLVQGIHIPVTCKIRILPNLEDTIALAKLIESTGVAALAIHGRTKEERSCHPNHNGYIQAVAKALTIPVIANGGSKEYIKEFKDIEIFRKACGAASVMVARAAQWNISIFRKEGMLPVDDVIKSYLHYAVEYFPVVPNMKYNIQQIYRDDLESPVGRQLLAAATVEEICSLWGLSHMYHEVMERQEAKRILLEGSKKAKRRKLEDGSYIYEMDVRFVRKEYPKTTSPKMVLHQWTLRQNDAKPRYHTIQNSEDKLFYSAVTVAGVNYASTLWEKSKKAAEQAAAVVCLTCLGMDDGRHKTTVPCAEPQEKQSDSAVPQDTHSDLAVPQDKHSDLAVPQDKHSDLAVPQDKHSDLAVPQDKHSDLAVPQDKHSDLEVQTK